MRIFNRHEILPKKIRISSQKSEILNIQEIEILEISLSGFKIKSDFSLEKNTYTLNIGKRKIHTQLTPIWQSGDLNKEMITSGYSMKFSDLQSFTYWRLFNQAAYKRNKKSKIPSIGLEFNLPQL